MISPEQIAIDPDRASRVKRGQRLRRILGLTVFLSVAISLLAAVAYFASIRHFIGYEIARLERERDRLQEIADRLDRQVEQAKSDERVVLQMLRQCRSAEDIPDLPGSRIVAVQRSAESLYLFVPAGGHTLEIAAAWNPPAQSDEELTEDPPAGEKTWTIPLLPSSGYRLVFASDRNGGPVSWELTSNHADFETQAGTVPLDDFANRGSSYSTMHVFQFPNQINYFQLAALAKTTPTSLDVRLMDSSFHGAWQETPYQVKFDVRLVSTGPLCIPAIAAANSLLMGYEDRLLPYRGDGKYEIRTPSDEAEMPRDGQ